MIGPVSTRLPVIAAGHAALHIGRADADHRRIMAREAEGAEALLAIGAVANIAGGHHQRDAGRHLRALKGADRFIMADRK